MLLDPQREQLKIQMEYESELRAEIGHLKEGIRNLQKVITRTFGERDELANELRDLFTPASPLPKPESAETDLD